MVSDSRWRLASCFHSDFGKDVHRCNAASSRSSGTISRIDAYFVVCNQGKVEYAVTRMKNKAGSRSLSVSQHACAEGTCVYWFPVLLSLFALSTLALQLACILQLCRALCRTKQTNETSPRQR